MLYRLLSTLIIGIRLDSFHYCKESVIRLDLSKPNPPLYSLWYFGGA